MWKHLRILKGVLVITELKKNQTNKKIKWQSTLRRLSWNGQVVDTYIWLPKFSHKCQGGCQKISVPASSLSISEDTWKATIWRFRYSLDRRAIKSLWYLLHVEEQWSTYLLHAGIGGLLFDASRQYTCLQSPCSPFAKYISRIPIAPFNTEKCKERLAVPFLPTARREIHNDPLRTTWDLGEQCLYCLISIGSLGRIGVLVLVNNCFLWHKTAAVAVLMVLICREAESNQALNMEEEPKLSGEDMPLWAERLQP